MGLPQPEVQLVNQAQVFCEFYGERHSSEMFLANLEERLPRCGAQHSEFHHDGQFTGIPRCEGVKEPDTVGGTTLIVAERNTRGKSYMTHLNGMIDLQLEIGGGPTTPGERTSLSERYLLNTHAWYICTMRQNFVEPLDDDEPHPISHCMI
ncbi:hypothetical protein HAX54_005057 [Datura stramonium]|uniref:Uncharacterized protein n=1 Tax=Datura stramonium TaxID=4076 RepID=A0ABS8WVB6_DATST|nr:hypothetical protein [Datura stramonium]